MVFNALDGRHMTAKQIQANCDELSLAFVKKVLGELVAEKALAENSGRYDHTGKPTAYAGPKLAGKSISEMRLICQQNKRAIMSPAFVLWCEANQVALQTTDEALASLKLAITTGPAIPDAQLEYDVKMMLAEELRVFHLEDSGRVERIPPTMARMRNRGRSDARRWVEIIESNPLYAQATTPGFIIRDRTSPGELEQKKLDARAREDEWWNALLVLKAGGALAAIPQESDATKSVTPIAEKQKKHHRWMGVPMTALIRYCGSIGLSLEQTGDVAKKLGLPASEATLKIQHKFGIKQDKIPKLDVVQFAEFHKVAPKLKSKPATKGNAKPKKTPAVTSKKLAAPARSKRIAGRSK